MKKTHQANPEDTMQAEYQLDYRKGRPNRFAGKPREQLIVVLDADVASVFTTPESVNRALRALISAFPDK
jgi:uncharacterized protein (DUF4415 family)